MQHKWRVGVLVVLLAAGLGPGPGPGMAWAQSSAMLGSGLRVMQHRARDQYTEFADLGLMGQPIGAAVYLGSRYGLHMSAELVRPYLAWVNGEFLESGAANYGFGASLGLGTRHNFSDKRFLLASVGLAASGLSIDHEDDLRYAYSNWGPGAQVAMYFRTRHNIYAFAGAGLNYHPDFNPVGNSRYKSGFSGGINLGIAAAAQPRP